MIGSLLMLGSPVIADDFSINAPPVGGDHLPKKGSATYTGTYATTGAFAGVSGAVQINVDFATGDVTAELTLPPLGVPGDVSQQYNFTPEGVIMVTGKHGEATYTLTQGVVNSSDQPFIDMDGSFSMRSRISVDRAVALITISAPINLAQATTR
jgi:hypothetical protein